MKKKKLSSLSMAFMSLLVLSGCNDKDSEQSAQVLPATSVAVLMSNAVDNPFFAAASKAFESFPANNTNIKVTLSDAKDDHDAQMRALDSALQKGAQAIVINMVDAKKYKAVYEKVRNFNVPVVFFNRSPGQLNLLTYKNAFFVDGDAVQGGVLQGKKVLEGWKANPQWDKNNDGKIQFAMLKGIKGNPSAEARTRWAIGTISSYPDISVPSDLLALEVANFKKLQAKVVVENWLKSDLGDSIEVILANNDSMALGALSALDEAKKSLPVFGIDAIPEARELVKQKKLTNTVVNDAKTQAEISIRIAVNLVNGKSATENIPYRADHQVIRVPYKEL